MSKRPYSTELQIWTPEKRREPSSRTRTRPRRLELSIPPSSSSRDSASFTLPADWFVDKKTRTTGAYRGSTDKYYHEPGTGRKFRSLVSVKRHLMKTECHEIMRRGDIEMEMTQSKILPLSIAFPGVDYGSKSFVKPGSFMKTLQCKSANPIVVYRKPYIPNHQVNIDKRTPLKKLPDGWFVKRSIRKSGHSMGKVDKYYCELATGRVFRSRIDVERYLADNYIEENTSLSKLFKPAGLIQMSGSGEKDVDNTSDMAIVPHSVYKASYSDHSDDVLLKDLVRRNNDVPLKDIVRNVDDVPLKDLVRKSADVPLKNFVRKPEDVPLKDLVQKADDVPSKDLVQKSADMPVKDLVRKSSDARKTRKNTDKLASPTANISPVIASNHPVKIKWVLNGPGGDDWSPFTDDMMVPESLKQEWAKMFIYVVSQKYQDGSSSDALD